MANDLYFVPSDLLGTEKAWNFYNCYNNWNNPYPWLGAVGWVKYAEQNGLDFSSVQTPPQLKYFNRLMKIIPLGIADGSLDSAFANPDQVIQWLMRSVGLEESALQAGKMPTDGGVYINQSFVRSQGDALVQQALEIAKTQGIVAARSFLANPPISTTTQSQPSTSTKTPTRKGRSSIPSGLRGLSQGQSPINPIAFVAIPLVLLGLARTLRS